MANEDGSCPVQREALCPSEMGRRIQLSLWFPSVCVGCVWVCVCVSVCV